MIHIFKKLAKHLFVCHSAIKTLAYLKINFSLPKTLLTFLDETRPELNTAALPRRMEHGARANGNERVSKLLAWTKAHTKGR